MNEILRSLTNRPGGYISSTIFDTGEFVPDLEPTELEQQVRSTMGLDVTDTDYYVKGILRAVDAFPAIRNQFGQTSQTYDDRSSARPTPIFNGGNLLAGIDGPAYIEREANEWPVQFRFDISYVTSSVLTTRYERARHTFKVRSTSSGLAVDWPSFIGIRGVVDPDDDNTFDEDFKLTVIQEPVVFPYQLLYDKLRAISGVEEILRSEGLIEPFYYTRSPIEGVAIMAIALGLKNKAVYS